MNIPAIDGGVATQAPAYTPPSPEPDFAQSAQHVLDTGSRLGRDDYDARMVELGKELGKGDSQFGRQMMSEILKRDPGALDSWLKPERANDMRASSRMTLDEEGRVANAFAAAYNHGDFGTQNVPVGIDPGKGGEARVEQSGLDGWLGGYYEAKGLGPAPDNVANATRAREFLDFINTSSSSEVADFRKNYGEHLLDQYVTNTGARFNEPTRSNAAAGVAANLLAGDASRPQIAVDTLAKYGEGDLKTIMDAASRSNGLYSEEALRVEAQDRGMNARDISVPNGSALLFGSVAQTQSANADKVALEFARLPTSAPDIFNTSYVNGSKGNIDGLTLAVNSHAKSVFDNMTTYDSTLVGGDVQQYMVNASELGSLFKTTLFNQDSTHRNMLQDSVTRYAGDLKTRIGEPGYQRPETDHLTMLSAAVTDGVRQGYADQAKAQAAKQALVGNMLDFLLSGFPGGKWVNSAVESRLKDAFPNNARLQDVLKGLSGKLVDTGQSQLNANSRKQIIEALGSEVGNLEIARTLANKLHDGLFSSITDEADLHGLETQYNQILNGVQIVRQ